MSLDPATCYRALVARDPRFDGAFFVAVSTTGIYCRPVCPARTPRPDRCSFYERAALAERDGFRACFTCRPELAPGSARVDSVSRLVAGASARIEAGALNDGSLDELAAELGVTARHLRRAFAAELGVSPMALALSRRMALAKQLVQDGGLGMAEVAFASGFRSVRRFNAAFRERFGRPPSELRRAGARASGGSISLRLDYRPPLEWAAMLGFLAARAAPSVERAEGGAYARVVRVGGALGWVRLAPEPDRAALRAEVSPELAPELMRVAASLRRAFDLDAHPHAVAAHLAPDPALAPLVAARPGLRIPGVLDPFEGLARAILGQQVSMRGATTLAGRLAARFGERVETPFAELARAFPSAETIAGAREADVAAIGVPGARARALIAAARALELGDVELRPGADAARAIASLRALPGVGRWTAEYVALRVLGWPDGFPAGDLVLSRALGADSARELERRAEPWRPWRGYAAMHLWCAERNGRS